MIGTQQRVIAGVRTLIVGMVAVVFVIPLVWMVCTSLKTIPEVYARDWQWLPIVPQWENYGYVWTNEYAPMARSFLNTLFVAVLSIFGQLSFASMAAYAFAKINFKGKKILFALFLSSMMVPSQVTIIPRFMMFRTIGLYNTLWSIILPNFFGVTAMFMLRQFYMGLPNDLVEAAKMDGAGHFRIFAQVMLPLTKAAVVSMVILSFISSWNEYLSALVFLIDEKKFLVSQIIRWYMEEDSDPTHLIMAASTISLIPTLILFATCQRYFFFLIATSGVKG